ncbi:MAG: RNA polymerase sigma-70 factor [Solirubrobacteraceae bacterium]
MTHDDVFAACRPRLLGVAYGMLGDRGEAEDVVQDAWLRWSDADTEAVRSAEAFLVTMTTRLAIDRLRSARAQRETYIGPWLPEPLVADPSQPDPQDVVAEAEQLSLALLQAMERLNPVERAVLLLRDVFDLEYATIANAVDKTPANCRRVAARARERLDRPVNRFAVSREEEQRIVTAFTTAATTGDLEGLIAVLAEDANLYTDGGGVVVAARKPISGRSNTARFLLGIQRKIDFEPQISFVRVNGDPGIRIAGPEGVLSILALELADGAVANVRIVNNPHKLTRV